MVLRAVILGWWGVLGFVIFSGGLLGCSTSSLGTSSNREPAMAQKVLKDTAKEAVLSTPDPSVPVGLHPEESNLPAQPQRVVLLTSVDLQPVINLLPWYFGFAKGMLKNYVYTLAGDFLKYWHKRGYVVEVYHYTDQAVLNRILSSPRYVAVYWLSHGAAASQGGGLSGGGLFDYGNFAISPVFQKINPNLRVLALVGCTSGSVADNLLQAGGLRKHNPHLLVMAFDQKVDARTGLKAALRQSQQWLDRRDVSEGYAAECKSSLGIQITLRRECVPSRKAVEKARFPAIRVERAGDLIGTLPSCQFPGEMQEESFAVRAREGEKKFSVSDLKFVVTTGSQPLTEASSMNEVEVGQVRIRSASAPGEWKRFEKKDGEPFGVYSHTFNYRGELPPEGALSLFPDFACASIAPRNIK